MPSHGVGLCGGISKVDGRPSWRNPRSPGRAANLHETPDTSRRSGAGMSAGNKPYDAFISYSRADGRHAAEIDSVLRDKGLKSFFDRRNLDSGLPWVRALEKAIGSAKAAIVLIGPGGFGNTQQYERELAIIRQTREPAFRVIPVIPPKTGSELPFDFLQGLTWIDFSQVEKVSDAPAEVERLLMAVQGALTAGDEVRQAICPWRGLDAFREEDSAFFFGRAAMPRN